jgi:hypothetical protein
LLATLGSVARAQDPPPVDPAADPLGAVPQDPGQACQEQVDQTPAASTTQGAGCDNKYTPIAKDGAKLAWSQWAGAVHGDAAKPTGYDDTVQNKRASIPPTVDFYTVSFANPSKGFAGGAQCKEDAPAQNPGETNGAYQERITSFLDKCVRVPVIYRFTDNTDLGPIWQEAYKGDSPGFVGAITWLHNLDTKEQGQRVLAVGGDSTPRPECPKSETDPPYPDPANGKPADCGGYPRREPDIPDDVAQKCRQDATQAAGVDPGGNPLSSGIADPTLEALGRCEDKWRQDHDAAGKGRAWLFSNGNWEDRGSAGKGLPADMRGMTALDAAQVDVTACGSPSNECALAGGLQQIWMWQDDKFDPKPWRPDQGPGSPSKPVEGWGSNTTNTNNSQPCATSWSCGWHYRVRVIWFGQGGTEAAQAMTSGCCSSSPDPNSHNGRRMIYSKSGVLSVDRGSSDGGATQGRLAPDSYYAMVRLVDLPVSPSYLAAPGGPERPGEPPSQVIHPSHASAHASNDALRPWLSSARLVAGDGNWQGHQPGLADALVSADSTGQVSGRVSALTGAGTGGDAMMDWAVGGFKPTRRAAAYTTTTQSFGITNGGNTNDGANIDAPFPVVCPRNRKPAADNATTCQPNDKAVEQTKSGYLLRLSSYFLNGFTFAGNSGVGWGVGDRGAIDRLSGDGDAAGGTLREEVAPSLGAKQAGSAPARQPYESSAPDLASEPGTVPARGSQPAQMLGAPRMTSYGTPNAQGGGESVAQMAISRDGSEGWAIGPFPGQDSSPNFTLFRFDGSRWRRCDTDAVQGVIEADPACESLWPLAHFQTTGVKLTGIARIPMEYGSDPTMADDFEAVAVASPDKSGREPILRYHDGRWTVDEQWTRQLNPPSSNGVPQPPGTVTDLAFSGPEDGWIISSDSFSNQRIYHYDGDHWALCGDGLGGTGTGVVFNVDKDGCRDHNRVIPVADLTDPANFHLTAAGDRLYLSGQRADYDGTGQDYQARDQAARYPFILYKDPGPCKESGDSGCWQAAYDPGCVDRDGTQDDTRSGCVPDSNPLKQGKIYSLSVALGPDGSYNGWGLGWFGATAKALKANGADVRLEKGPAETPLIHSDAGGTAWELSPSGPHDPASQYLLPAETGRNSNEKDASEASQIVALPGPEGKGSAVATAGRGGDAIVPPAVRFDPGKESWHVLEAPYCSYHWNRCGASGSIQAMAPDNGGGLWVAASPSGGQGESIFYRFSAAAPPELFDEVAHPIREPMIQGTNGHVATTTAAGGGDGSFWVLTSTSTVYRYDRQTGWDRMTIPGWDPGRFVTNPSPGYAIAIGKDGNGVLVGKQGRIADVGTGGARLDPAAGVLCFKDGKRINPPPCGTGRDLRAAAVAPDGSAMVGGDSRSLLYRERNGAFDAITPPPTAIFTDITGISLPEPDRAWVTTEAGEIYSGTYDGSNWSWRREDADEFGDSLSRDRNRKTQPLWAIAMDASGHGYAVGANGTIIERTGQGTSPWRRADAGVDEELHSVTLGPGGKGALIGGDGGLILSELDGRFEPARYSDRFAPTNFGYGPGISRIAGLALLPGYKPGQIEAWAASQVLVWNGRTPPGAILHYTSDPSEPLLDGEAKGTAALKDVSAGSPDELSFAAFGNSECQHGRSSSAVGTSGGAAYPCPPLGGSNEASDRTAGQVRDELLARKARPGGPDFNLFTGDVGSIAGTHRNVLVGAPFIGSVIHDRWRELIAEPLAAASEPVFGAMGGRDLGTTASTCQLYGGQSNCFSADDTRAGLSVGWRQSMAGMPAPWGALGAPAAKSNGGLTFEPVDTGGTKKELEDTIVEDPTKSEEGTTIGETKVPKEGLVGDQKLPTGGAHTHYALDVKRGKTALLRLVVLDTSLKSLAASTHNQNPVEEQLGWLKDALQRPDGERAVVLTNTPTYSYGPGAGTDTLTEGTALESILIQNKVDLVVDGRLGWNALYYAMAPGVHWPCPGSPYPTSAPPSLPSCGPAGSADADKAIGDAQTDAQQKAAELTGGGVSAAGKLPFLVSHSAGGKFGPDGQADGSAADGYWRGYSIVHLDPTTGQIRIEQRPVFDWVGIRVPPPDKGTHVLRPGQKTKLQGFGREVLGTDMPARYTEITTAAITHCYDLVWADQEKPWLPLKAEDASEEQIAAAKAEPGCKARRSATQGSELASLQAAQEDEPNPCDPYVCLPGSVGTIQQDGQVRAGSGEQKRTFALAVLSVNQKVATYPLSFEPRPSFSFDPPSPPPPPPPPPAPPAPPTTPPNQIPTLNLPTPPALPNLPLGAELVPPAPPIPPPPPAAANVAPLNLFLSTPGINIAPTSTVIPPPAPPIQPAPPGGARKEARQRQAAAQKSGSEATEEGTEHVGDETKGSAGDLGMSRRENSMSRRDQATPGQSFTPLSHHSQPSAWATGLQWGGGLTLMALVFAFGWTTVRPTPRRRMPEVPAPAWNRNRGRR